MSEIGEMTLEETASRQPATGSGSPASAGIACGRSTTQTTGPSFTRTIGTASCWLSPTRQLSRWLKPFGERDDPDVVFESHAHWAVGHVDGFSIRVCRDGEITDAFRTYHGLMEQLDAYPILDESDYGSREYEAALENIADAAWHIRSIFDLDDGWEAQVHDWLSAHRSGAVENRDDRGACPSKHNLQDAVTALGYVRRAG